MRLGFGLGIGSRGAGGPRIAITASRVLESAVSGSTVGVLSVVGGTGVYTFTEIADPDNKFVISGSNLNTNAALSFATNASHTITVRADNGAGSVITQTLTITVVSLAVPVLSDPIDYYIGTSAANLTVNTTANNGTLYWFISTNKGVLSAATIKAGTGAVQFGSQSVTNVGRQTIPVTGLNPATSYYLSWVHTNNGLDSNMVRGAGFMTDSAVGAARVVFEGDSITTWGNSYAFRWAAANPTFPSVNQAIAIAAVGNSSQASGFNSLWGRVQQTIANKPDVLSILIGTNDIGQPGLWDTFDGSSPTRDWLSNLLLYTDYIRANVPGVKIVVGGVVPGAAPNDGPNAPRAIANPALRARVGNGIDAYAPIGDVFTDADATDTFLYSDTLHPSSDGGHARMFEVIRAVLDPLLANSSATTPAPLGFIDQNNLALSAVATGRTVITGMSIGRSVSASVTGGRIARGTPTFGAGPLPVCNGDFLFVEGTAAATIDTAVDVPVTVGATTDTFTVRTAPSTLVEFAASTDSRLTYDTWIGGQSSFNNVTFPAGRPVLMVEDGANSASAVTIDGVSATAIAYIPTGQERFTLWVGPPAQVLTAGTYNVVVTSNNQFNYCAIAPGAFTGSTQPAAEMATSTVPMSSLYLDRRLFTAPPIEVRNGGLALYAYFGADTQYDNFLDGTSVYASAANAASGDRRMRWGTRRSGGTFGVTSKTNFPSQGMIVVSISRESAPTAPVITSAGSITGTRGNGNTITGTAATATGNPTPTLSYQWQSDSGGWANISGATGQNFTDTLATESLDLRRVVTATNSEGSATANSNTLGTAGGWILATGAWNDLGSWDDTDTWKDS